MTLTLRAQSDGAMVTLEGTRRGILDTLDNYLGSPMRQKFSLCPQRRTDPGS